MHEFRIRARLWNTIKSRLNIGGMQTGLRVQVLLDLNKLVGVNNQSGPSIINANETLLKNLMP